MRIWTQCIKELNQFRRDRLTLALAFFLPSVALLLYGYATRLESKNIALAVRNYDLGILSNQYVDAIFATGQLCFVPYGEKDADILAPLDNGVAKAALFIPPEFSRKIRAGLPATVQVVIDATDVNNARIIRNSILSATLAYEMANKLPVAQPLLRPQMRLWFNPGRKESLYIVPGAVAILLWIFPSLLSTLSMAREREQGTVLQLYTSSLSSVELIAGKALAYVLIGMIQTLLMLTLGFILFDLRFVGSPLIFFVCTVIYLFCAVTFGLFAASRTSSQSAAVQVVATLGFTTALLLSGFIYPVRNIQYPLSLVSNIVPARYFVEICRNTFVRGSDALSQLSTILFLAFCCLLTFIVAVAINRKMQLRA